jgi:isoleucyl-tRNA synthetase
MKVLFISDAVYRGELVHRKGDRVEVSKVVGSPDRWIRRGIAVLEEDKKEVKVAEKVKKEVEAEEKVEKEVEAEEKVEKEVEAEEKVEEEAEKVKPKTRKKPTAKDE